MGHNVEDPRNILADQLVVLGQTVPDRPDRTGARHPEHLLQFDLSVEPALQSFPGIDVAIDRKRPTLDRVEMISQYGMDQSLLVLEVMIKLAFAGFGCLDYFIRTGLMDPLLSKELRCRPNNSQLNGLCGDVRCFHDS